MDKTLERLKKSAMGSAREGGELNRLLDKAAGTSSHSNYKEKLESMAMGSKSYKGD